MTRKAPTRIAAAVLSSLGGGVVPRVGLEYITVGRQAEIHALLRDVEQIAQGGAAFRFLVGQYGAGKSFLLQTMRNHVMEKGFIVLDCDLTPQRRFCGSRGQGAATYQELVRNLSTRTKPDGGALPLLLDRWAAAISKEQLPATLQAMQEQVHGFDFSIALQKYWQAFHGSDDDTQARVLRWLRGEYTTKTAAKQAIGINLIVNDDNWYDFLKLLAGFAVQAGYAGMLVMVDELVNLFRIPHRPTRQCNYEKLLSMYNDALQGKAQHIGFIMGVTPQALEDSDKGLFSYDALRSRLAEGRFASTGVRDLLAPVIRLAPLSDEELLVLCEKLAALHAQLYDYQNSVTPEEIAQFLQLEFARMGAAQHITPREVIRDFIELLNLAYQSSGTRVADILAGGDFVFAQTAQEDGVEADFAEFEV
ncbi:MAG: ATP-binding protein [Oscillospiraceae bacterium]|nr:ATP-binding protein [Oscillospiraceae bacterium]